MNVTGSQGADTKHKVFWITQCADIPLLTAEQYAAEQQAALDAWLAAQGAARAASEAEAARIAAAQAAAARAAGAPGELPRTGGLTEELLGIAIMAIAAGAVMVRIGRRSTVTS